MMLLQLKHFQGEGALPVHETYEMMLIPMAECKHLLITLSDKAKNKGLILTFL